MHGTAGLGWSDCKTGAEGVTGGPGWSTGREEGTGGPVFTLGSLPHITWAIGFKLEVQEVCVCARACG